VDVVGDGRLESVELSAEVCGGWDRVADLGQAGAEESAVGAAEEHRDLEAEGRDVVAVGPGDALDDLVQAQAAEVIVHPARGHGAGIEAQQWCEVGSQVSVGEPGEGVSSSV
jgi:hypothetical protein